MRHAEEAGDAAGAEPLFGRIELVIFEGKDAAVGKRIDLMDEERRKQVANVTTHAHLQLIFDMAVCSGTAVTSGTVP